MVGDLEYRALLAVDIAQSAGRGDPALREIRSVLFAELRAAFEAAGIDWNSCLRKDLGDGMGVTAPPDTELTRLIHPLVARLSQGLRAHNRKSSELFQVRARVAVHAGHVRFEANGVAAGQPFELLARLLDASKAKKALAAAPQSVCASLLISQHVYDEAVQHGYPGIDPDDFRRVAVAVKEYSGYGWLHLPGAVPISPAAEPDRDESPEARPTMVDNPTMVNNATGHGTIVAAQHGDQHIRISRKS